VESEDKIKIFTIRELTSLDQKWVVTFAEEHWGSDLMIVHGTSFYLSKLPGYFAEYETQIAGLITYFIIDGECEIISLNSLVPRMGIGSALINSVQTTAIKQNCQKLCVTTTNDNIEALLFYQKLGFVLAELRREAVIQARTIKPQIPAIGNHNIPIRDEIELEKLL